MTQWTVQIEPVAGGRYQWRHVPVQGDGEVHQGTERYDSAEVARRAGEAALADHHETGFDAGRENPQSDTRFAESDAALQVRDAEARVDRSPVAISNLPVEAEVRAADDEGSPLTRH
ncbi:hypothetical protein [Xylophilus sp. GOD-11R]|uniref:hypothetical protein n=1 Tax=Xylophilus sp. GOD-11R TaxID=3089814 RepID=UPI00298D5C82|nr:hypothetical protein [Xylophilus sp. GOD-11R]WPB58034.1 hypothetical protein R9X41_05175 [Xylophilus sp. GOD-11R]